VGEELTAAVDTEPPVERGHVLMHGRVAHAEAARDLLLGVAFDEARERLAEAPRQALGSGLGYADQCSTDERPDLAVEELELGAMA